MGFWNRVFGGSFTLPPPDETDLSDKECLSALRPDLPRLKSELKAFTLLVLANTPQEERDRLVRRVLRKYAAGDDSCTALCDGLLDHARGQKLSQLCLMAIDHRGYDGFEYLAPHLVATRGIIDPYRFEHDQVTDMASVLEAIDAWLVLRGCRYLHLDTGNDQYTGFIAPAGKVKDVVGQAAKAGLKVSMSNF